MNPKQIAEYREKIDLQLKEKSGEIESHISLIIVAALGFFLTINEKFIGLKDASLKYLLLLSISSLFLSFGIFLLSKYLTTHYDRQLIDFLDQMEPYNHLADQQLLGLWRSFDGKLSAIRSAIYCTLGIGILLELVFFWYNVESNPRNVRDTKPSQVITIIVDSSKEKALQIYGRYIDPLKQHKTQ